MSVGDEARGWLSEHWNPELTVREWWAVLAESGYAAPMWPKQWFGLGLGRGEAMEVSAAFREAGAIGAPAGLGVLLAAPTILTHGTDVQKARYLKPILEGTEAWCQLFSEPGAGSDLASLSCRAERDGDEWVITGQKVWTSHGHLADLGMLIVRTDPNAPKHRGISYFAIDMHQPGIEVRPLKEMTGRAMFNEVFLDEARVSHSALIGDLNAGWAVTNTTLAAERSGLGAGAGGAEGGAFPGNIAGNLDRPAGSLRRQKGSVAAMGILATGSYAYLENQAAENGASQRPEVRQELVRLWTIMQTGRVSSLRARANAKRGRGLTGGEANLAKLAQSDIARIVTNLGPRILGANGLLSGADAPDEGVTAEMALFATATSIYGGSDQIQRNIIGERVLGLPKEPGPDKDTPFRELRINEQAVR